MSDTINTTGVSPLQVPDYGAALVRGLQVAPAVSAINALSNININDPDSIDTAMQGSIRAGQIEQAGALANLAFTRNIRAGANGWMNILANAAAGQQPQGQPQAQPQAQMQGQPQQPQEVPQQFTPDQIKAQSDMFGKIDAALNTLKGVPQDKRAAAVGQISSQYLGGIPSNAVEAHVAELQKNGFSDQSIDALKDYHQQALSNMTAYHQQPMGAPGAQPAQMQPLQAHPATYSWARNVLNNPQALMAMSYLKMAGIDMQPMLEGAKAIAAPELAGETVTAQKSAEMPFAAPMKALEARGTFLGSPTDLEIATGPEAGSKQHFLTGADAAAAYQQNPGMYGTPSPQMAEYLKKTRMMPINLTTMTVGGREVPTTEGIEYEAITGQPLEGQPGAGGPGVDVRTGRGQGGGQGAGAGQGQLQGQPQGQSGATGGPVLGKRTPEEQSRIDLYTKRVGELSDPKLDMDLATKQNTLTDVIALAGKGASGPIAQFMGPLAQRLGPLLGKNLQEYGDNYAKLEADMSNVGRQQLQGVAGSTIRNKAEFDAVVRAAGGLGAPKDSLVATSTAALAAIRANRLYNQFVLEYDRNGGNPDPRALADAWKNSPQGKADLRGDPAWMKTTFNGKPGLVPYPGKPGWGIFMPGLTGGNQVVKLLPPEFAAP
jgi:hypothetical protein